MKNKLWITWEIQQRNRSMSKALDCELHEIIFKSNRLTRYLRSIVTTIHIYLMKKPSIIFAQNPSIVLAIISILYGRLTNTLVVIDAHNAGINPLEGKNMLVNLLSKYIIKFTQLTIVTNKSLSDHVIKLGGRSAILPDPLPDFNCHNYTRHHDRNTKINVLCISSWASDEPYLAVIEAGHYLNSNINIHITGNSKGKEKKYPHAIPDNVILTGFLDETSYIHQLCSSDIAMVLTLRDDCMVCGAYESVTAETPMILSDTPALRTYFSETALYTENNAHSIADAINYAASNLVQLKAITTKSKTTILGKWLDHKRIFDQQMSLLIEGM